MPGGKGMRRSVTARGFGIKAMEVDQLVQSGTGQARHGAGIPDVPLGARKKMPQIFAFLFRLERLPGHRRGRWGDGVFAPCSRGLG